MFFRAVFRFSFFLFLFASVASFGAEKITPPSPQTLTHWVRLTDGSLLVGRVESIDAEQLRIDLRLEQKTVISVPRRNIAVLVVIPPVDPVLAKEYLEGSALDEPEPMVPNTPETIDLVDGEPLSGRLRSFSKGVFRFDFSLGAVEGLFLESQPISWRRVRTIHFRPIKKNDIPRSIIFLNNGSKIFCDLIKKTSDNTVLVKCGDFLEVELPLVSVFFSSP